MPVSNIVEQIDITLKSDASIQGFRITLSSNPEKRKESFRGNHKNMGFELLERGLSAEKALRIANELHNRLRDYENYDAPNYRATLGGKQEDNKDEYHIYLVLIYDYDS